MPVQHFLCFGKNLLVFIRQFDILLRDLVIRENDLALRNKTVGIEHAGKGLGQDGFTGAGLTDDRQRFVFINVQRDIADRGQDSAADIEFYFNVFQ